TAMAATAADPEAPLSPGELLLKGEAEKPEDELEEEDNGDNDLVGWNHFLHDPGSSCRL
uniref:Uncharacterized protein n=1 Tax=Sus scrofa TaxID=9823 RepID=A0A8D1RKR7_PIG